MLQLEILAGSAIDPPSWDAFIEAAPEGGLFSLHSYLTVLRPDWQAAIVSEDGVWQAVMPFFRERKYGFSRIGQPAFSQFWGPVFCPDRERNTYGHYSWKRKVLQTMLAAWEKDHLFIVNCSPAFDYPLPFSEAGYELHTRYTYQLDLSQGAERIKQEMDPGQRRKLRQKSLRPIDTITAPEMLGLYAAQAAAGHDILGVAPLARQTITQLMERLPQRLPTYLLGCRNPEGALLAGACFVEFRDHCYYLFGTYEPHLSRGSEMARLMWEMISTTRCPTFDFEGSMIPGIARFFRRMGGKPVPYLQLRKNALPLPLRWISEFR